MFGVLHFNRLQNKPWHVGGRDGGTPKGWGGIDKSEHAQGLWIPPTRPTKGSLAQILSHAKKKLVLWAGLRGPHIWVRPNRMTMQDYWGRLWALHARQATLSVKMENQNKMTASEEHVHGDNKEKAQRRSQKRPNKQEELANGPVNCQLDFKVSVPQRGWVLVGELLFPILGAGGGEAYL